jgi:hypothetical protein
MESLNTGRVNLGAGLPAITSNIATHKYYLRIDPYQGNIYFHVVMQQPLPKPQHLLLIIQKMSECQ